MIVVYWIVAGVTALLFLRRRDEAGRVGVGERPDPSHRGRRVAGIRARVRVIASPHHHVEPVAGRNDAAKHALLLSTHTTLDQGLAAEQDTFRAVLTSPQTEGLLTARTAPIAPGFVVDSMGRDGG